MDTVLDRFLRYVKVDTQSDENSDSYPSTQKQFDLCRMLVDECRDLGLEDADGRQSPGVSVYTRSATGELVHNYSQSAIVAQDEYRGMDLLSPVWHFFDLLPAGRGEWFPSNA